MWDWCPYIGPNWIRIERIFSITFPRTKSLINFVIKMNREPIHSPARSIANLEFHHAGDHVNDVARHIVKRLEAQGIRALNRAMGFPMRECSKKHALTL